MNSEALPLERWLAGLRSGTWVASIVIAIGLILTSVGPTGMHVAEAGIGMLILLPVARVILMLLAFLRARDYRLALAAGLVLSIIAAGIVVGIRTAGARG